ncbi:ADP-glucose pyrophosphorylase [Thiorhodovibrio frisius]|uniref:ADP-glucose pyrophosphorylase n=1 Tax=Thiorhodovibrio frisius TaxID=631362 RepID=H8Z2Z5_9GAMM|nr:ADP-glucose pyrophosphorylase [Thiorhodovibrio frisius]WPL22526.1 Glucose-1-phosphate adenylyltransferase [Thiorhodovibrio frisius]
MRILTRATLPGIAEGEIDVPSETLTFLVATERGAPAELTEERTKAAVPFGGKYRVVDFSLANCLHSGLRQILVLTQYRSHSLHKHLRDGWSLFNAELGEFITPLPPQMRADGGWYLGLVDALRQNRYLIERNPARRLLLLDGGAVYRMDYAELLRFHDEQQAQVTAALRTVTENSAPSAYRVECSEDHRITGLLGPIGEHSPTGLAPMGVLVIGKDYLLEQLDHLVRVGNGHAEMDFVATLLQASGAARAVGYRFGGERGRVSQDGYWSDLGSVDAYYQAHMSLLEARPALDLYQPGWNILTYQGQYPPARTVPGPNSGNEGVFVNSMLASGALICGGAVNRSVLSPCVKVDDGAIVDGAILFDRVHVGAGAELNRCILDKDVVVSPGARIGFDRKEDRARFSVSPEGVVVVPKDARV